MHSPRTISISRPWTASLIANGVPLGADPLTADAGNNFEKTTYNYGQEWQRLERIAMDGCCRHNNQEKRHLKRGGARGAF